MNYCVSKGHILKDDEPQGKQEQKAAQDTLHWLKEYQLAAQDEFAAKQAVLEGIFEAKHLKNYRATIGTKLKEEKLQDKLEDGHKEGD